MHRGKVTPGRNYGDGDIPQQNICLHVSGSHLALPVQEAVVAQGRGLEPKYKTVYTARHLAQ